MYVLVLLWRGVTSLTVGCLLCIKPQVIPYSLSYACLKSVNYALFFWLPFYLTVSLNMNNSQAGLFSVRATRRLSITSTILGGIQMATV